MKKTNINTSNINNTTKSNNNPEKAQTRIKNWSAYNEALATRSNFKEIAVMAYKEIVKEMDSMSHKRKSVGRPRKYSDAIILAIAVFRELFKLSFREAEVFAKVAFSDFNVEIPDYSTIERRMGDLNIDLHIDKRRLKGDISLMVDSTGYKIRGEGEWKIDKHGEGERAIFVKVHYAVDHKGEQILGLRVTISTRGDNLETPAVLAEVSNNIGERMNDVTEVLGDGAYNTKALKKLIENDYNARLISPPKIKPKKTVTEQRIIKETGRQIYIGSNTADNQRCNDIGRAEWKNEIGYHKRSLVETNMFRLKSSFGDKLSCKTSKNQIAQIMIRAMILNIWTNKWMPKYTKP